MIKTNLNKSIFCERFFLAASIYFCWVSVVPCWNPYFPGHGEGAYGFVVAHAVEHFWAFGKDIVFTYGPFLNYFGRTYYSQTQHLVQLVLNFFVFSIFIISCFRFSHSLKGGIRFLLMVLLCFNISVAWDCIFFYFPMLLILDVLIFKSSRASFGLRTGLLAACMLGFLYKGTVAIETLLLLLGLDFFSLFFQRKVTFYFFGVIAGAFALLLIWKQPAGTLLSLLQSYLVMTAAFPEALQLEGPIGQIVVYLISFAIFGALIPITIDKRAFSRLFCTASLSLMAFVFLKAGFVRHDGHSNQAIAFITVLSVLLVSRWKVSFPKYFYLPWSLLLVLTVLNSVQFRERRFDKDLLSFSGQVVDGFRDLTKVVLPNYMVHLKETNEAALAGLRSVEVPALNGSVDVMHSDQTALLAHHMDYRPRPVFLHYSVSSAKTLELNREFIGSSRAPLYFLFSAPEDEYLKVAFHNEGANWPTFWSHYRFEKQALGYSIFKHRDHPIQPEWREVERQEVPLGKSLSIPAAKPGELIWTNIDVRRTWLGAVWHFLFKLKSPRIVLHLADGKSVENQLVTEVAREGFVISFAPHDPEDFAKMSQGLAKNNVQSIEIRNPEGYSNGWYYRSSIQVRFRGLKFPLEMPKSSENGTKF